MIILKREWKVIQDRFTLAEQIEISLAKFAESKSGFFISDHKISSGLAKKLMPFDKTKISLVKPEDTKG